MTTIARFVGINKHLSPEVPDLGGATRDAVALWALFKDTFKNIDAELIVDHDATVENIRTSLLDTLTNATDEDNLILAFSGHGTRNHRIVAHDTDLNQLNASTISMADLADRFRRTKARSVIFILDCCFSGAAPARVLDQTPASREIPFSTASIKGKGRVLITASGLDEPAYEHPGYRHGILTYSIVKILTNAKGNVPLPTIMDQVMEQVRSTATALSCSQTPIAFNLVEGGLTIDALVPGQLFRSHFPETVGIKIDSEISGLRVFGLPETVLTEWEKNFSDGLNSLQLEAINEYRILDGESLLVVAPTSAGKTFVGEMAAIKAISEGRKAVFLLPYRSLVNEKYDTFSALYGDRLNMRVIRCTGDFLDETRSFLLGKFDIAVFTFEMFLSLAINNPAILSRIGLIVLDEAQFITDDGRGIVVELILTRLRVIREQGIRPQLIALSATIGSINRFDEWLGVRSLITSTRPVPLEMGILDRSGQFDYLDQNGNKEVSQLIPSGAIYQRGSRPSSQDILVPLARHLFDNEQKQEKLLVFRNTRGAAEGCANYLANELALPSANEVIEALPVHDLSTTSSRLRATLANGVAFHNSNLTRDERILVERSFRDPKGNVRVLVATTTVAAGINTPASTVVLVEHDFPWENKPFSVAEVKNMAGRAGRLGFREAGRAVLLASSPYEGNELFQRYVIGKPEDIRSSFQSNQVGTWLLRLLAQVKKVKSTELIPLINNTYGGFLATIKDPEWQRQTQAYLTELVPKLVSAGLLSEEDQEVSLTLLGQVCGESSLSLESSIRLIQLLRSLDMDSIRPLHLMALIQALSELDDHFVPIFRKGQREAVWPGELDRSVGYPISPLLQKGAQDYWGYYGRAKRACILLDWIQGLSIESLERRFTTNPFHSVGAGDIRGIADSTRFHLRSAYSIASMLLPGKASFPDESDQLLQQLELGVPATVIPLLTLPFLFTRGEYLVLATNGISSVDEFWLLTTDQLKELLGNARSLEVESYKKRNS